MSQMYATVALPRAGKSSFANEWKRGDRLRAVVCADDIRRAIHKGAWNSASEPFVHATEVAMIRALRLGGYSVLVDETNTSEFSLRKILQIDSATAFVYFDTDPEECIRRAHATNQDYLLPVILRCYRNLEKLCDGPPTEEKVQAAIDLLREEYTLL